MRSPLADYFESFARTAPPIRRAAIVAAGAAQPSKGTATRELAIAHVANAATLSSTIFK
jgi:hypothetical protein